MNSSAEVAAKGAAPGRSSIQPSWPRECSITFTDMQQVHATSATSKNENHNHGHGRRLYTTTDDCHSHGHVTANPPLQQQRQQQHQHQHQHQQKRKLQDCILSVPETFQALVSPIGFASPRLHPPKPSLASLQDPIQLDRYDSLWVMSIQPTPQAPHRQWSLTLLPLRHEQKVCTCSHPTLTFDSRSQGAQLKQFRSSWIQGFVASKQERLRVVGCAYEAKAPNQTPHSYKARGQSHTMLAVGVYM